MPTIYYIYMFVLLYFFVWPLYCLSFDLRILITPLVSSNFLNNIMSQAKRLEELLVEQECLTIPGHPSPLPGFFRRFRVARSLVFCVVFCRSFIFLLSFVFYPLYCLSSDYPSAILKHFLILYYVFSSYSYSKNLLLY